MDEIPRHSSSLLTRIIGLVGLGNAALCPTIRNGVISPRKRGGEGGERERKKDVNVRSSDEFNFSFESNIGVRELRSNCFYVRNFT